ncbi:MAG: nuclear transport factor 2 family protein [Pseudomonadota bacterium]
MTAIHNSNALQAAKKVVRAHHASLDAALPGESARALAAHTAPDWRWMGMHPFHEITGAENVARAFWDPLKSALRPLQRRLDLFIAGHNDIDSGASVWVASMGHLMGLLDDAWLAIPATGKIAMLRYAEFHRVADNQIAETALFIDIPHLMIQAGIDPWPQATAMHLVQPGPMNHQGILFDPQAPEEGATTLALINAMIADLGTWKLGIPLEDELRRTWHEDMIWWGPAGIGATYTIPRYAQQHAAPFRAGFANRSTTNHLARIGEGAFGGFFGWPNFMANPTGGFMGMPGSETPGPFRVVDFYRRSGDKLSENWVFIDLLHFWASQGVDVLANATANSQQ